ncbi:MAG: sugar nucleotide-binding protein [Alphaproteobacteria bacterium]|nr:sugar nucleotide-binding protein [Alphaproteobacteria bacterium]MBO4643469.1 sugar nucleotide-binding protein [Alphaproteobacteria bacterium]
MYAVVGANGYLGSYVIKAILGLTNQNVIATARDLSRVNPDNRVEWVACDVQDDASVDALLEKLKREERVKIVYLAAYHNPDNVEKNKELAWDINVTCLSKFLNKATFAEKIYYASTDSVYGESVNGYRFKESDPLTPVNFYGHNKGAAEALLIHRGRNVVRFPFLISPSIIYKPHFYDVIVENIRSGKPFEMFADSYRSSLSFENAGKLWINLMERENIPQIVNICGDRDLSKYDVGLMIADREGVSEDLIIPISVSQPKENFETRRAASTLMDNTLLKTILGLREIDIFSEPR